MSVLPLRIGSDPEFVIVANGLKLPATKVLETHLKGWDGAKKIVQNHGILGRDHNEIAEIRPTPEYDPLEHAKHIGKLLETCHNAIPLAELKTVSLWAPIGGHVHLETPGNFSSLSARTQKIIHQAMMSFTLPLFVGENHINARIRIEKGGYGKIEDVRIEQKDGTYTWEFRPLTAEWITSKETTEATLAYLGVIWNQFVNNPDEIKKYKNVIVRNVEQAKAFQLLAIDEFQTLLLPLIKQIKKHVQTFDYYNAFKEQCDLALNPKEMLAIKEKYNWNIVEGWKFSKEKSKIPSKRNLNNDKHSNKRIEKINLDLMKTYQQIFWSNDRNVEKVARAIGDRAIAWNWNLSNRYFFFALPKEATNPVAITGNDDWITGQEMVKTKTDADILTKLVKTAKLSFCNSPAFEMKTVNLKNGKAEKDTKHSILIGVPYNNRESGEYKKIMGIIHDLETNKIKDTTESLKDFTLPDEDPTHGAGLLVPKTENITPPTQTIPAGSAIDDSTISMSNDIGSQSIEDGQVDPLPMYEAERAVLDVTDDSTEQTLEEVRTTT